MKSSTTTDTRVAQAAPGVLRRPMLWGVASGGLVVLGAIVAALYWHAHWWTFDRVLAWEASRADMYPAWVLWVRDPDTPNPLKQINVGATVFGESLPGQWEIVQFKGDTQLRGLVDVNSSTGAARQPWRGKLAAVGETVDTQWHKYVRFGRATDFELLGCDASFVGRWNGVLPGVLGRFCELEANGRIRDETGADVGRWAGSGGILLTYVPGWDQREILRFVRDPGGHSPSAKKATFGTFGCETWILTKAE